MSGGTWDWALTFRCSSLCLSVARGRKEQASVSWFYEIRSADDTVLKRDGGFPTQDAAKTAGREDGRVARVL